MAAGVGGVWQGNGVDGALWWALDLVGRGGRVLVLVVRHGALWWGVGTCAAWQRGVGCWGWYAGLG